MNARILVDADPLYANLVAATLAASEVTDRWFGHEPPEDTGTGFMEFFDWLAGTSDQELHTLASSIENAHDRDVALGALLCNNREAAGLAVWRNM